MIYWPTSAFTAFRHDCRRGKGHCYVYDDLMDHQTPDVEYDAPVEDIAERTGLSRPTVIDALNDLVAWGYAREGHRSGRGVRRYTLMSEKLPELTARKES